MQAEVAKAVTAAAEDTSVTAIVVTGAGDRAFCAGQDLEETEHFDASDVDAWLDSFVHVYDAILSCPKPVVAALNGVAAGSGYQLAIVCDYRVAHEGVRLGQPEVTSGIPSVTGHYLTVQCVGHSRTVEMMLGGRLLTASEAFNYGLINAIVAQDKVLETAIETAHRLGSQPAMAFALTKRRIRDYMWPGLMEAFEAARVVDEQAWGSGEPQAVARRFFDTRRKTPSS